MKPRTRRRLPPLLAEVLRKPPLLLWAAYVASVPFYFGPSGLPQPGNALLIILFPLAVRQWNGRLTPSELRVLRPLLAFTLWTVVINLAWAVINGKAGLRAYVIYPFYYIFNATVLFMAMLLYRRERQTFLRVTGWVVVGMVFFLVGATFVVRSAAARNTLFFNNPNQLGYYALISACLLALVRRPANMKLLVTSCALVGCAYLALRSGSRASTAGTAILFVLLFFADLRLIIIGAIASLVLVAFDGPLGDAIDYSQSQALLERDKHLSFVEERGYDRLWDFREHLLLGAGEGDYARFGPAEESREIHSSAGTLVFCYGLVGLIMFATFVRRLLGGADVRAMVILLPTFAYSFSHQGLRFTMFWVLLATFMAAKTHVQATTRHPTIGYR